MIFFSELRSHAQPLWQSNSISAFMNLNELVSNTCSACLPKFNLFSNGPYRRSWIFLTSLIFFNVAVFVAIWFFQPLTDLDKESQGLINNVHELEICKYKQINQLRQEF